MSDSPPPNSADLPFDEHANFDPAGDFEAFLKSVPAKWVIYLLADEHDQPIQLLCVKNLRYSLKRRLGGDETIGPTRRISYREIVRRIHWRRVDSHFEADWLYYEAARKLFPQSYQGMVSFRPAWFIHIDPDVEFPRYVKTINLIGRPGKLIGPVEDKHAAARLIELIEDSFDLCRYYNILLQSPHGSACAYKEMGKCPAPCDGSISMDQYRLLIDWSLAVLNDPFDFVREQKVRMQQAADDLRFETAARIKSFIQQLSRLGKGSFRHAAEIADFQFLCFQRGPKSPQAHIFLITPGKIEHIMSLLDESFKPADVMRSALSSAAVSPLTADGVERIGIIAHHLFSPKHSHGVFLRLNQVDEKSIARAYREIQKQAPLETIEDEGVMKELQSL
jgi:excinuclease UvrABC nuclease subunit